VRHVFALGAVRNLQPLAASPRPSLLQPAFSTMEQTATDPQELRAEGAARERAEILALIERYVRHLAHGHGVTGAQVLQQLADEVARRGER
jgi:hypothetical protein